ncbi:hypothetical protein AN639_01510 [Candidatus Epulonipiscium fishelsonii]|uniref:Uncharacterized protein n=1 Tax=Candidatus Epulonipiscium fishelsonii TaxID=77094 RepID=A0ACC8XBU4_9FIRM|nr:hypothetical protein AN639_01510 [Epulopiscium sp. SCG-B05WGA-EpuloA1]ONI39993.1 hypothetical protein AN396_06495 [Epulopiscium sp. SCG-B11WGA-EpuloA1]
MRYNIFLILAILLVGCSSAENSNVLEPDVIEDKKIIVEENNTSDKKDNSYISKTDFIYDTVVTLQIYDNEDVNILNEAFELCHEYEDKFSRTIPSSEISRINAAKGKPVTVSDDTIELLELGIYYSKLSGGVFDITIAPVSMLWNFTENKMIPSNIEVALNNVDYNSIVIEGNTVTLTNPDAMIDLGGIAKGFIADKLKAFLKSKDVTNAIINLGGNVLLIGSKPDGSDFNIGIQEPFAPVGSVITTCAINDSSLVTSGVYERYFMLDDKIYHHIIDPTTGYPFETDLYGVTIISESSATGDAMSTICLAKGLDEGLKFLQNVASGQNVFQAIFITDNMDVVYYP